MRALGAALVVLIAACDGTADLEDPSGLTAAASGGGTSHMPPGDTGLGGGGGVLATGGGVAAGGGVVEASGGGSAGGGIAEPPIDAGMHAIDAGLRDAGTHPVDAGHSMDAGTKPPSLCAGSAFALCDGFEGSTYDRSVWTDAQVDTGNSITTDSTHVMRGERSLRVHLAHGSGDDTAQLFEKGTFPELEDTMYGRVFIYMEADPPAHNMSLVTGHQLSPHQGTYGDNINVTAWYAVQWNQNPHIDEGFSSGTHLQLNAWMCLEWMYSGSGGETRTWLNGTELTDLHKTGWVPVQFQQFDLGIYEPHGELVATGGYDVWLDELALDVAPIGCSH